MTDAALDNKTPTPSPCTPHQHMQQPYHDESSSNGTDDRHHEASLRAEKCPLPPLPRQRGVGVCPFNRLSGRVALSTSLRGPERGQLRPGDRANAGQRKGERESESTEQKG